MDSNASQLIPADSAALYWPVLPGSKSIMNQRDRIRDILATYQKHGWQLRRVLLLPETRVEVVNEDDLTFKEARIEDANLDALWFSRPSHGKREAWELRLIADTPYALFEMFDANEPEEAHEAVRQEMQVKLSEFTTRKRS
jgi:hypothetical protein